jgi:hypothetical protein
MRVRKTILAAASLALSMACGGSTFATGSATVNGTVGGQSMAAHDAVSALVNEGNSQAGAIAISNAPSQCSRLSARQGLANAQVLGFELFSRVGSTVTPPTVGTYPVYSSVAAPTATGPIAVVLFVASNASCQFLFSEEGSSGTVTLSSVGADGYVGTFDVVVGFTDHITGNFTAVTCGALASVTSPTSCGP